MVDKKVEDFFTDLMHQAVEHREKNQIKRDDYLEFLINMRSKKQFSELDMAAHGLSLLVSKMKNNEENGRTLNLSDYSHSLPN